jgi:uncharacterized protein YndB with AHSA1/START domain
MGPLTVSVTIDRPREEVFAYLLDIANHATFSDHYLVDWRLTREESVGRGAGARFRVKKGRNRFNWADVTLVEVEPPRRIVTAGRGGKGNRVRLRGLYTLEPGAGGTTRVEWTIETRPALITDRVAEALGQRRWLRRRGRKALKRLARILEDGEGAGPRVTVAGG